MQVLSKSKTVPLTIAAAAVVGVASGALVSASQANAETASTTTSSTASSTNTSTNQQPPAFDVSKGGHVGSNGTKEELLTGDTAEKVKAAALAAQPGATIQRVETDAEGAAYEAHIVKSDGSVVTLKFDSNYKLTATEDGPKAPKSN